MPCYLYQRLGIYYGTVYKYLDKWYGIVLSYKAEGVGMTRQDKKDFEIFQKEFKYWQTKFGCNDWQVYFRHKELEGSFASIISDNTKRVAGVNLSNTAAHDGSISCDFNPKEHGKHEAIHLLLSDLAHMGLDRHATSEDLEREEEKLVVKLMGLIK
jgi:hypothetical protein